MSLVNFALSSTASGTNTLYSASYAIDGVSQPFIADFIPSAIYGWSSNASGDATLHVDLGSALAISQIDVISTQNDPTSTTPATPNSTTGSGYLLTAYTVEYSTDDSSWTTLHTVSANTYVHKRFDESSSPITARYWRITCTASGDGYKRINELQLWGDPPPDSNPPTVSITSPSTGGASISGNQNIVVTCSDDVHVTTLSLIVDGDIVDTFEDSNITGHTFILDTLRFSNGDHDIKVRANDDYNDTDSSSITKTFANTFTITGDAKLASNASDTYTTNIPDPTWSKDSGSGSINASTGEYTAPSSGIGVAVLRATGEFDSTQTKNVLYGFPYEHNNGNSRTFDYADLPAGYDYKAQVKSLDEQNNTLGYTDWVEQP